MYALRFPSIMRPIDLSVDNGFSTARLIAFGRDGLEMGKFAYTRKLETGRCDL
jgi:hypothetical protein